ncbi:Glutathione S-transferase [Schizosaccharomyces pombe]
MFLGTLYSFKTNTRTVCLLELAKRLDLQVDLVETYPHKFSADLAAKFPLQKLPVFIGADGFELSEVIAIVKYFYEKGKHNDKEGLGPVNEVEEAEMLKWMCFINFDIVTPQNVRPWVGMFRGNIPYEEKPFKESAARAIDSLKIPNELVKDRTYLVGDRFTLADLFFGSLLRIFFNSIIDEKTRKELPHLTRYYITMFHQAKLETYFPLELPLTVTVAKK